MLAMVIFVANTTSLYWCCGATKSSMLFWIITFLEFNAYYLKLETKLFYDETNAQVQALIIILTAYIP